MGSEAEREEDEEATSNLLRDRFRLSTISIAESQAKQFNLEISPPIVACISDLAFKFAEILAKDVALFARHGGRKSVNMEDVILSVHRNEHLVSSMRSFSNDLKAKEPQPEKRIKKAKKDDLVATDVGDVPEHVNHLHRNEHLALSMRSFSNDLKAKEPQPEKRRKKAKKEDLVATDVGDVPEHVNHLHWNENLVSSIRSFRNDLKTKQPQSERRRKKSKEGRSGSHRCF